MRYTIIIERGEKSFGAYVPDLPGCAATAGTEREVLKLIREGIEIYVTELKSRGEPVPKPSSRSAEIEIRL